MELTLVTLSLAIIQSVLFVWLKSRLEASIKSEKDRLLEDYRYEMKVKEQAAKVAEYFSYYFRLTPTSSEADYRRANQLNWELALWLPEEVYRNVARGVARNDADHNILSSLIAVRKVLLVAPGNLTADDLVFHAPNAKSLAEAGRQNQ